MALNDLKTTSVDYRRWANLAMLNAKRTYWRAHLGVLWLPMSFVAFVLLLALLWANILGRDFELYLPHLGYGLACFAFMSTSISGGEQVFVANAGLIREFPLPLTFYAFAKTARDFIALISGLIVMLLLDVSLIQNTSFVSLLALPAIALYFVTSIFVSLAVGMAVTRFRDLGQILPIIMRAVFFFTPIIWMIDARPERALIAALNPLYHYIEIIRAPMSGIAPTPVNWAVSLGVTMAVIVLTLTFYKKGTRQLRVWL